MRIQSHRKGKYKMKIEIEDQHVNECLGNLKSTMQILYSHANDMDTLCEYLTIKDLVEKIENKIN